MINPTPIEHFKVSVKEPLSSLQYHKILEIQQSIIELIYADISQQIVLERLCQLAEEMVPTSVASIILLNDSTEQMSLISIPSSSKNTNDLEVAECCRPLDFLSTCSEPIYNQEKILVGSFTLSSLEHLVTSDFHKQFLETCAFLTSITYKCTAKKAETSKYKRESEIFGTAIKNTSDGMLITNQNNIIMQVNDAFLKIFDYQEDEVIGKNPSFLASGYHDAPFYEDIWTKLLQDSHWSGEIWNKRKNGEIFPEWMSISLLENKESKEKNYLAVFTDLSSLRESQEKVIFLAYHDQLTGLLNRQKIIFDIAQKKPTACVIFNIDDFKEVNDFFGIDAADRLLKEVGEWFRQINDSPYRIAGDEFAFLIYDELSWDKIYHELLRVLSLFEEKVFMIKNENINIRITIGVAMGQDELFTRADIAMHQGKDTKTSITLYEEDKNIEEKYHANITMSEAIRKAIGDQRIICYYQPIVNLLTGKVHKYETLVRMIDENGSIIPPLAFLSIAKKINLYPQITLEVVKQACELFATRTEEFSINVSDSDICNKKTNQEIIRIITKTGTAPRVVFEILESEGIENYDEMVKFITQVKLLGSKISIDDFGTGYSNFENILKLNVDYIKIDGSLIQGITKNTRHHIIVETIVAFAHKIGAKTIAEFVSDASIYSSIKKIGIDYSQGYYTGKPEFLLPAHIISV